MAYDSLNLKDLEYLSVRLCTLHQLTRVQIHMFLYVKLIYILEVYWRQACQGLEEIHSKQYLHGDIKPENMLMIDGKLVINDFDSSCPKDMVCIKKQKR